MANQRSDRGPREPRPVFLSIADVLDYSAMQTERMAADQSLIALIGGIAKDKDLMKGVPDDIRDNVNSALIEPDRQERVLREAAKIMRNLATEHRVLDMKELDRLRAGNGGHSETIKL